LVFVFLTAVTFSTTFSKAADVFPPADGTKVWSYIATTNPYLGWVFGRVIMVSNPVRVPMVHM
jgi:hypothetical protein